MHGRVKISTQFGQLFVKKYLAFFLENIYASLNIFFLLTKCYTNMSNKVRKYGKIFLFSRSFSLHRVVTNPVAEFSVSICSIPKFICSSDDGVPRLLIIENENFSKRNICKYRIMR